MDLNPKNYNLMEITKFFGLQPNHSFTQVNDSFRKKHSEILVSSQVTKEEKDKMLFFINQLKDKLVLHLTKQNVPNNTFLNSLPNNFMNKTNSRIDTVINSSVAYNAGVSKQISADTINPIERNILNNVIHFDTRFKQNYVIQNQSKFTFNFPTSFKNVISTRLISFELPDTIYNITKKMGNNSFFINVFDTSSVSGNDTKVTINEGKYTSSTLITEIQTKIQAVDSNFNVTHDAESGFIKIEHNGNLEFVLRFPGVKDKVNLGYILGFRSEVVNSTSNSVTSSNIADFDFNNYFYLSFDDYQRSVNHNHFAIMNKNFVTKNIFAKLKNKQDDGNTDYFVKKNYFGPVTLDKVSFELLDRYGNSLDLKGLDYSFSVELELLYKY